MYYLYGTLNYQGITYVALYYHGWYHLWWENGAIIEPTYRRLFRKARRRGRQLHYTLKEMRAMFRAIYILRDQHWQRSIMESSHSWKGQPLYQCPFFSWSDPWYLHVILPRGVAVVGPTQEGPFYLADYQHGMWHIRREKKIFSGEITPLLFVY